MKLPLISTGMLGLCITLSTQAEDTNTQTVPATANDAIEEINITGLSPYSATKSDTPVMDTPRSISIITQEAITERGATSLADATAYNASVTANKYGFATRGDWIAIRGLDAPIYQDSLQSLFGSYNNSRPPIYGIEQIEILKGPSAVLYGSGGAGGIVNIVTKKPQAESKGEIALEVGSFKRKQLATDWTGSFDKGDKLLYRFVGLVRDSETQVDYVEDKALYLAPSFTWQPSENTSLTALLAFTQTKGDTAAQFLPIKGTLKPAPNGQRLDSDAYVGEPDYNKYDTTSTSLSLLGEHRINDNWSLLATSRYSRGAVDYQQAYPSFLPDIPGAVDGRYPMYPDGTLYKQGTVPRSFFKGDSTSKQWAIDFRSLLNFSSGIVTHKIILGIQHQQAKYKQKGYVATALGYPREMTDPIIDDYWINVFQPVYGAIPDGNELNALFPNNPEGEMTSTGIYFTDQITINNMIINAGIRHDNIKSKLYRTKDITDKMISLDGSVMYQFDFGLSPYVSYADGFDPVLGINDNGKALKPKISKQYEIGTKYQPVGLDAYLTTAYFVIKQENMDDPNSLPGFNNQIGKGEISGYEIEGFLPIGDFSLYSTWSKLDSKDQKGFQLASIPEQTATLWIDYHASSTFLKGLKAGFGTRYNGESQNGTDTLETPSYTLMDAMLGYENAHVDITLNVNNLAGKTHIATCLDRGDCFYGVERNAVLSIAAKF